MKTWQEAALRYSAQGMNSTEISILIEFELGISVKPGTVKHFLWREKKKNQPAQMSIPTLEVPKTEYSQPQLPIMVKKKQVVTQNFNPENYEKRWDGVKTIRFAVMGDTQFGSKYAQITHLHNFYDICVREGITDIYHTGDITDGLKMRPGHEYELYASSADEQLDDVVANYPKRDGITTYFITGNHDASLYKHVGYDIGKAIAMRRPDMYYLGRDCAVVDLTPNCTLELRHPWDGSTYAVSHKLQKIVDGMSENSKPSILVVGHYHKDVTIFYKNVYAMITGSFQGQTPFLRGKNIDSVMGGYIVTVYVDTDGNILGFQPWFIPYTEAIIDDYKNYTY